VPAADKYYGFRETGTKWTDLTRQLQTEAEKGGIKISNSWDDIARWMGVTPRFESND